MCAITVYKIIFKSESKASQNEVYEIPANNYTNILKSVHDDVDTYVGQSICFTGYVYRVYDLTENQFVLARDMVVSSDFQTMVVGFLCTTENAKNFKDGTWVEISLLYKSS